ncbi:hypothetical protein, partial [Escherichia coli]|uniref:hypothetical protein n=1 Tax=Escherichia coli TaxID=562 RepID=UPI0028FC7604
HFLSVGLGGAEIALHTPGGLLRLDAAGLVTASQQMADAAQKMATASEKQEAAAAQQQKTGTPPVTGGDPDKGVVPAASLKAAL